MCFVAGNGIFKFSIFTYKFFQYNAVFFFFFEYNTYIVEKKDKTPQVVTDSNGKNCLEGYYCYIQFDYGDSRRYPFCSKQNNPNSCGGIGRNGCSLTSTANAIAFFGIKSSLGTLHTPYTVWDELYPINIVSPEPPILAISVFFYVVLVSELLIYIYYKKIWNRTFIWC